MVEQFKGRISEVSTTHRFKTALDLEQTLSRYVVLYNQQLPHSTLRSRTRLQSMKSWFQSNPELVHRQPYDRPRCNTYCFNRRYKLQNLTLGLLFDAAHGILRHLQSTRNAETCC